MAQPSGRVQLESAESETFKNDSPRDLNFCNRKGNIDGKKPDSDRKEAKMRNSIRTNIEFGVQIVIAIAVVLVAGVLIKRLVFPQRPSGWNVPSISAGERLNLRNVDWKQNKKSLVFFLKKDCPYCTSSAALYRQLLDEASKRNVKCIAVLPNSPEDARKYLQYLELPFENIYTGPVEDNRINGTPTIIFVDQGGIVKSVWIGAQTAREKEMRDKLVQLFDS